MILRSLSLLLFLAIAALPASAQSQSGNVDTLPVNRKPFVGVISLFVGGALPSHDAPQGPNLGGFALGVKLSEATIVGFDASFAGTSEKIDSSRALDLFSSFYGISLLYYPLDWLFITAQPTLHRVSYTRQVYGGNAPHVAAANTFKIGLGAGLRVGSFSLDAKAFPAFARTVLPDGRRSNTSQYHVRLGYHFEISLRK